MDGLSGVNCVPHPVEQNHSDPPHHDEPLFVDTPCRGWVGDFTIYLLPATDDDDDGNGDVAVIESVCVPRTFHFQCGTLAFCVPRRWFTVFSIIMCLFAKGGLLGS